MLSDRPTQSIYNDCGSKRSHRPPRFMYNDYKIKSQQSSEKAMAVVRWTDEMLDGLASSVGEMRDSITEVRASITEMRDSITEMRDSIDGLRVTTQALLQVAAQHQRSIEVIQEEMELTKQRQAETDERFNVLLEELRYLIRRNDDE